MALPRVTPPVTRYLLRSALLALAYYAAAWLGTLVAPPNGYLGAVSPPAGVAMAALLLLGLSYWPAIAVGTFVFALRAPAPWTAMAVFSVFRALAWAAGAWLVLRVGRVRPSLPRVNDVVAFVALGAVPATLLSLAIAVAPLAIGGQLQRSTLDWALWCASSITGVLVITPALLVWAVPARPPQRTRGVELVLLLLAAAGLSMLVFAGSLGDATEYPLTYAVFPLVAWAGLRAGQRGATMVTVVVAAVALGRVMHVPNGELPEGVSREQVLLFMQAYLSLVSLSGMVLAALTGERRVAMRRERRERRRAEAAERRWAFLAEVGPLLGGSLDYHETLAGAARLVVPRLGDGCIIDELADDGEFGAVVTRHRDPAMDALLGEMRRLYPPQQNPNSRVVRAVGSGRTELVPSAGHAFQSSLAVDERHRRMLGELDPRCMLFVPMVARGEPVGVLTLMRTGPGRHVYTPREVALAEEVARRAAMFVDNARLYRRVHNGAVARQKVVSMVSHEVRNPLSTILLNATAALDGTVPAAEEDMRQSLRSVVVAAEQIGRLMQDLTDVTRLESGSLPVERIAYRPCTLVREAALMLEPIAARRRLRLVTRIAGELPEVLGDRERTLQVLTNLVGNAVRYTPAEGSISVEVEETDAGEVRFCVADTGCGIPSDGVAQLFTPLWDGDGSARGMGLPLSRAIVEAQGGRMWAESAPGQGSRFYFTLPAAPSPSPSPTPSRVSAAV